MATRGGGVSKSATKALRTRIGGEEKRGISTFLFRRSGSIGVFVADLDNPSPRTGRGRVVVRLGEVHDVGVGVGVGTGEAGGRGPGGCPVRPCRPRPSAAAGPAQAPRSARTSLNRRERLLEVRSRGFPGDLADRHAAPPPPRTTAR